ncbi:SIS domain-containing protein [Rhodococcus sp. 06-156-3C]|nr:SIS domain-containing protein [Rhodococcus sp. 06-156-4C]OZD14564.1 SIS domain-containing protein [Rhodococcus sp. 06-156-4a]OZD24898.1 SIS domain-containing protein [Rhodococcus sp. 06-156-3C]OZD27872.1 SIS domain-containing protein [Rhodococcus sp. 06-156-3b]OZD39854.1 SIS domain-containing protein [Rhodococcus sp. 06-156-3]OZF61000.1 SIS domain-containing protein [Rhodococcus sp. 06-156-4]
MILFTNHVSSEVLHMSELDDAELQRLAHTVLVREASGLNGLADTVEPSVVRVARALVETRGKVITTGSGTSGIMAERLAHLLSVCGTPSLYLPAMDALHGGMAAISTDDLVLAISKTGRSAELTQLTSRLVGRGIRVVAVTEAANSPFARAATDIAELPATAPDADPGNMIALASTLAVGAWGDAVSVVAMALTGHTLHDVVNSHPAGGVGTREDVLDSNDAPVVGL